MTVINKTFFIGELQWKRTILKKRVANAARAKLSAAGRIYKNMWTITTGFSARVHIAQQRANRAVRS